MMVDDAELFYSRVEEIINANQLFHDLILVLQNSLLVGFQFLDCIGRLYFPKHFLNIIT